MGTLVPPYILWPQVLISAALFVSSILLYDRAAWFVASTLVFTHWLAAVMCLVALLDRVYASHQKHPPTFVHRRARGAIVVLSVCATIMLVMCTLQLFAVLFLWTDADTRGPSRVSRLAGEMARHERGLLITLICCLIAAALFHLAVAIVYIRHTIRKTRTRTIDPAETYVMADNGR